MYAVIDFETTNLTDSRRATEVAIAVLDTHLNVLSTYESLVNPQEPVFRESLGHSRLTKREIEAAPIFSEIWPDIAKLLSGNVLVMHNSDFDRRVLENEFAAMGLGAPLPPSVCTLRSAQRVLKGRTRKGAYSLSALASELGFEVRDAHRASADVEMTAHLLRFLIAEDRELRLLSEAMFGETASFEALGLAVSSVPRSRFVAEEADYATLLAIAHEIAGNPKVCELREVCRTGDLLDQNAVEEALCAIGFTLQDRETRKSSAFLIQGANAGKRKVDKALHYARPVITESDALGVIRLLNALKA
jgi:DNA polymerase III epsilon subunit-like protein